MCVYVCVHRFIKDKKFNLNKHMARILGHIEVEYFSANLKFTIDISFGQLYCQT